jgi:integrase
MHSDSTQPRPRGTGSLLRHKHRSGAETWYGKWRVGSRQVMRALGPVRAPDSRTGLTSEEAEQALRRAMEAVLPDARPIEVVDVPEAGRRYLVNREAFGLKRSTLMDYESYLRVHLSPFFSDRPLEQIDVELVEAFIAAKRAEGKAVKSVLNYLGLLHAIFANAVKRGWCHRNPVALADKPRAARRDPDIRFLSADELEALLAATPDDPLGRLERLIYLTAAMTGMRRGELLALRWQDVDWENRLIRVRRNYTKGEFGTPKSRRSSRSVPLADRVASALRRHFEGTRYKDDIDLVFGRPNSGTVLDPSKLRKRFISAARRAGLRPVRFHDLRHTFGTRMASAGAPLRAVQEWMGHSDYRTTSLYADYAPDLSQGAVWAARAFGENPSTSNAQETHRTVLGMASHGQFEHDSRRCGLPR